MKTFALKILWFLPVLCSVIGVNYTVDPAKLFRGDSYEAGIAALLLKHANVANLGNYDERMLQRYYIAGLTGKKQIVVMGSSRTLQIRASMFPGKTFANSSVSGASLRDDLAIYEMYHRKGITPSAILLGLDPWLLNANCGDPWSKCLGREYIAATAHIGVRLSLMSRLKLTWDSLQLYKYPEILSPNYFQQSLTTLWSHHRTGTSDEYFSTTATTLDVAIKLPDGSFVFDKEFRSQSPAAVRQLAISFVDDGYPYGLENFREIDSELVEDFERFVGTLQAEGVTVVFFLAPYHPETYKRLSESENYKVIIAAQNYYVALAKRKRIQVVGSYNPADCACGAGDFYDGMHPGEKCIERMMEQARPYLK